MDTEAVEKVAVIGIGCRLPPAGNSLTGFWKFLLRGGNALRPIRRDRWDWRQYGDTDPKRPGKTYAPKAAMLDADIQQFDPLAFGMSPREAASLDPQQRLLLESAWEAFEDAGLPLERLAGSCTGVFVGGFCLDHLIFSLQPSNRHLANAHTPGGVMMTVLSNRLSHAFDLRGPSLTLDTACSSSLVALHYACQSLITRESEIALAGGVNVMTRPEFPMMMSKGHFLSPHGECHTFDETAAGYARGEGAGILVLKRLDDALAAGDPIHAVIRGTGVNQDGHTDGISLPNSEAQEALVREVYRRAGVAPAKVDYVEAHGTGTQAGDPAELQALDRNFAPGRTRKLLVGSVKTNIGHLEAAAGVAGVIKAIAVLKHRQVPKNLHFRTPNPRIPFADYQIEIPTEMRPLPTVEEKPTLFAGVNSFGYGGTNAHAVLESAPAPAPRPVETRAEPAPASDGRLFPFSARSEEALRDLAGKCAFVLGASFDGSLDDLASTLAFRRSHLPVRAAVFARDAAELRERLIAASTGQPHEGVVLTTKDSPSAARLAFVYTGMGPQWWGMGQELFRSEPIAAATLDEIDAIFAPLAGWSLREAMLAPEAESRMARTEVAQPANFAIQLALTRIWAAWGVTPAAVVGHSVGEVTAAHVAGVYTLAEAVRVSFHRSRLQQTTAGRGAMLAVGLAEAEAAALIVGEPGVSIAAINSFSAVTLSGESEPLQRLAARLEERGVFQKFLRVEVAYHSPQMDPLHDEIHAALADLAPQPARLPLYSTAHGAIVPGEAWTAGYWWRNVRQPVRFAAAMQAMFDDGFAAFLEVGPHPVLGNSIKECAAHLGRKVVSFTSLRRAEPERPRLRLTLAELYAAGAPLDWSAHASPRGRFLPGPQYPWQRQVYWNESERSRMERLGLPGPVYLNRTVPATRPTWEVEVNRNYFPFLFDHGVQDQTVFAGLGYIEAALAVGAAVHGVPAMELEAVSFERVLVVDPARIQVLVSELDPETGRFRIASRVEGEENSAQRQCRGRLHPLAAPASERLDLAALRAECPQRVEVDAFYADLRERGLHYGPAFRPTVEVNTGEDCFLLRIDAENAGAETDHPLHPTLFDAAIQPVLFCAREARLVVPFSFDRFTYFSRPAGGECYAFGRLLSQSATRLVADVWLTDAEGNVHARVHRMALQAIDLGDGAGSADTFYEVRWQPAPLGEGAPVSGPDVLVLADDGDPLAAAVGDALSGAECAAEWTPGRTRLVVLWGAAPPMDPAALNARAVALLQKLGAAGGAFEVTFVTRDAQVVAAGDAAGNFGASALGAVALVAENEFDGVTTRAVDVDGDPATAAARIRAELTARSRGESAWRSGDRFSAALQRRAAGREGEPLVPVSLDEPLRLRVDGRGRPDGLRFERTVRREPEPGEVEVRVHRVSWDGDDLRRVLGRLPAAAVEGTLAGFEPGAGIEGEVVRVGDGSGFAPGDRVVGLAAGGAARTFVTVPADWLQAVPPALTGVAAAAPLAFWAAERGLLELGRLAPGERVLLLRATEGAGLAAARIARAQGAEVFATAESEAARAAWRELGVQRVFEGVGLDFVEAVRSATNGAGIDVIFGAPTAAERSAALSLLRAGGRFIELGRRDLAEDADLPLRAFTGNVTFATVDVERLAVDRPTVAAEALRRIIGRLASGEWAPVPTMTFGAADLAAALDALASGGSGRVLVDLATGEVPVPARPARAVRPDGAYIVTGGTSGFGLITAQWLAAQGAARVWLVSRSGPSAPGVEEALRALRTRGTEAEAFAVDVTDAGQVRALIERAGPALRGVVHGAMVLDDAMMADVTPERFARVFEPKVRGALNFAEALRGRELDFVAFYSSVSALVGNRGQTSYVAANAVLDGLARSLRAGGVPAISINWGALAESGVVARDERLGAALAAGGIRGLTNAGALAALGEILRGDAAQVGVFDVDWGRWHEANPGAADDPRFLALRLEAEGAGGSDVAARVRGEFAAASGEQRLRALEGHLQEVLAATLKMAPADVALNRKVNELGVDSLMVLELGLGIEERIGIRFSAMELLKGPSIEQLAVAARGKLWGT